MLRSSYVFLLVCFLLSAFSLDAQSSGQRTYKSLDSALNEPDSVRRLDLSGQKLKEFPTEIFQFSQLEVLKLNRCKISELPQEWPLPELKTLDLGANRITDLPEGIASLAKLEKLRLGKNTLTALPESITRLHNLEILDVWGNDLRRMPEDIGQLSKLKIMDLRVMEINMDEQERIARQLPETKIFFTEPCNCMDDSVEPESTIDR